jgi:serine/threonine protein kinase/Flp pilus assembly protein TadD
MATPNLEEKAIFNEARRIEAPDARRRYLEQACAVDRALLARIEALLRVHEEEWTVLQSPAEGVRTGLAERVSETPGTVIGPYMLRRLIGEGGMGTVFLAEQAQPVQRLVALKIITPGLDSGQVLARFEAERQALALMDHPNIAKVLDAGTTPMDRPYFVMELVNGVPITNYCDEHRLTPRQRLGLFVPICQAVQHAHQKGIIHRDLKPSNVLVAVYDGQPVPKIIDFGVAKAIGRKLTERTLVTALGSLIGTPEYMSPEQAELHQLDIDTRSDVYSLGVLLYELLTGTTPMRGMERRDAGLLELLRRIREEEPPPPSARLSALAELPTIAASRSMEPKKLQGLMRGELDWIMMKCLEKDRTRRYETADRLARDIERYLRDEPVEAGPPSAGYRLRKYARKHKKVLATVGAFAALLVGATAISIGLASWALQERNHAEEQKRTAEANFKRALEAVDHMLTRVGEAELLHVPQMEPVRHNLLQDALRFYQEFLKDRGDSSLVRSEAASAYRRMGQIQVLLGQRNEGEEAYRQAVVLLENLLVESPDDPTVRKNLAGIHNDLGVLYITTQRWSQAETTLQQAVALLEELGHQHPTLVKNRLELAKSHNNLVILYRQMGRLGQAETAFLKSRTLLDNLLAEDPKNVESLTVMARCHQNVGLVYGAQGRTMEAEAVYLKALALNQQLARDHPQVVDHQKRMAGIHNNLGLLYTRNRQHDKAEMAYKQSLALNEAILRDHPKIVAFIVDVGASYGNMATHIRRTRSPKESLEWSARAIRTVEPVLEQDPRDVGACMCLFDTFMGRGQALLRLGRREEATKDWWRMIELSAGQSHINMRLYRPPPLARLGEHVQAAAEVETLLAEGHAQGLNLYTFAYVYSLCSSAAAKDGRLPPAERERLADKYGGRAVELLRKAQNAGYFQDPGRLAHMKEDEDLDAIRSRPDFQRLLIDLEYKAKPQF